MTCVTHYPRKVSVKASTIRFEEPAFLQKLFCNKHLHVSLPFYSGFKPSRVPIVNSHPPFVYVENDQVVGYVPEDPFVYGGKPKTEPFEEKFVGTLPRRGLRVGASYCTACSETEILGPLNR